MYKRSQKVRDPLAEKSLGGQLEKENHIAQSAAVFEKEVYAAQQHLGLHATRPWSLG
jgi:hypothetical protein